MFFETRCTYFKWNNLYLLIAHKMPHSRFGILLQMYRNSYTKSRILRIIRQYVMNEWYMVWFGICWPLEWSKEKDKAHKKHCVRSTCHIRLFLVHFWLIILPLSQTSLITFFPFVSKLYTVYWTLNTHFRYTDICTFL